MLQVIKKGIGVESGTGAGAREREGDGDGGWKGKGWLAVGTGVAEAAPLIVWL